MAPALAVLDTRFATGVSFFAQCADWYGETKGTDDTAGAVPPRHYVGLLSRSEAAALPAAVWRAAGNLPPAVQSLCAQLMPHLAELADCSEALHTVQSAVECIRIHLDQGRLLLTLYVGPAEISLGQLALQADHVCATHSAWAWDKFTLKQLARCCRRGAHVLLPPALLNDPTQWPTLRGAGFVATDVPDRLCFDPPWVLRDARYQPQAHQATATRPPGAEPVLKCAVIGAGLSGASVAYALAHSGWAVDVYEQGAQIAAGASGLPLGLMVPHYSRDDSPRSRLSRAGIRLTLAHARQLLRAGQDWECTGALELQTDTDTDAAPAPSPGDCWTRPAAPLVGGTGNDLWHANAAWVKPAALVAAWLAHPAITLHPLSPVHHLERSASTNGPPVWCLCDVEGNILGQANTVVFANARASASCILDWAQRRPDACPVAPNALAQLGALQAVHGCVSMGDSSYLARGTYPPYPVHGNGHFVAGIPHGKSRQWFIGATFETDILRALDHTAAHSANQQRVTALLPGVAAQLAHPFRQGAVDAWVGTRCVSHDRLPLVGPLELGAYPSLWIATAMGSRGLSYAALAAELLAAQINHTPWPLPLRLGQQMSSLRPLRKRAK